MKTHPSHILVCLLFGLFTLTLNNECFASNNLNVIKIEKTTDSSGTVDKFVDLGLPSGTLWRITPDTSYYYFDEAILRYGDSIPTTDQWEELFQECQEIWLGRGFCMQGPNGNIIILGCGGYKNQFASGDMVRFHGIYGRYWAIGGNDYTNRVKVVHIDRKDFDILTLPFPELTLDPMRLMVHPVKNSK